MTRKSKKEYELKVLNFFLEKVKKYSDVNFRESEQPDFIDMDNSVGIEVTEFHNSEMLRKVEVKLNHSINIAEKLYLQSKKDHISVYLHFNFNFLKRIETGEDKNFKNNFSEDLKQLCINMVNKKSYKINARDIRLFNENLSKVLNHVSVDIESSREYNIWQFVRSYDASIDEKALTAIIRKKEELLNNYKIKNPEIRNFVLLISTGSPPVIGLKNTDKLYSTTGSLKYKKDIKEIDSEFNEVYIVDMYNDKIISNLLV